MLAVIPLAAKIAADYGIVTLSGIATKKIVAPYALKPIQKLGVMAAELAISGIVIEKTNVHIDKVCMDFDQFIKEREIDRKFKSEWTTGYRTDYPGKEQK